VLPASTRFCTPATLCSLPSATSACIRAVATHRPETFPITTEDKHEV